MARHFSTDLVGGSEDFPKREESESLEAKEKETSDEKPAFQLVVGKDSSYCFYPINNSGIRAPVVSRRFSVGQVVWIVVVVLATMSLVCCGVSCATRQASVATNKVVLSSESAAADDAAIATKVLSTSSITATKSDSSSGDSLNADTDANGKNEGVAEAFNALATKNKTEGGANHGVQA